MKKKLLAMAAAALLALAACAEVPHPGREPPVAADKARLYVYREIDYTSSPIWTTVSLNSEPLGASAPGTVFYRDVAPGTYQIEVLSAKLYPNQFKTVRLAPGSTTFVKVQELYNWGQSPWQWQAETFVVNIMNPAVGAQQMAGLRLTSG